MCYSFFFGGGGGGGRQKVALGCRRGAALVELRDEVLAGFRA